MNAFSFTSPIPNKSPFHMKQSHPTSSILKPIAFLLAFIAIAKGADSDFDGLDNAVETNTGVYESPSDTGTDPTNPDTDDDGVNDGLEVQRQSDPTKVDASGWRRVATEVHRADLLRTTEGVFHTNNYYSLNGVDWQSISYPPHSFWINASGYGGGTFVLTGAVGQIWTSNDFRTWSTRNPGGEDITEVAYGNGVFVARKFWSTGALWVSSNQGQTWSSADTGSVPDRGAYNQIAFGNGVFVRPGETGVRVSSNGSAWSTITPPNVPAGFTFRGRILYSAHSGFVLAQKVAAINGEIEIITASSSDGRAWSFSSARVATSNTGAIELGGSAGEILFVNAFESGRDLTEVWCSADHGQSWRLVDDGPWGSKINDYAFFCGNSTILAVGTGSEIHTTDLTSFARRLFPNEFTLLLADGMKDGAIQGTGDYLGDSSATITAVPNPGYRFTGWTGDASGTENPLTLTMDADKTVGATFEKDLSDADADGLNAYDELVVHGTNPSIADSDGDNYSDSYEIKFSTNPNLASSVPTFLLNLANNGMATGGTFTKSGTLAHDTNATLTATPSAGYLFGSWTGDASGLTNPLTIIMDSDKTVGATFIEDTRDPDGDGLTNYQEIITYGTNTELEDTDGDSISDSAEIEQGRDPLISEPVVSNLTAVQRPGTKLVDITYDVTADTPTVKVTLEISSDGGTTYSVPVSSATGSVGTGVAVGTGKTITWNAGADWDGKFTPQIRFRLMADVGFSYVAAGSLPASSWAGAQNVDAFYMAKTEVTWSEFQTVRTWAAANGYDIGSVGAGTGPNRPVTNVNWYQTLKWCNARSEKEGLRPVYKVGTSIYRTGDSVPTIDTTASGYRLPSEKEWEFAARGGVKTNGYEYSGSNDINAVAWYLSTSGGGTKDVATKLANELGISDMSGNVVEWCFDIYSGSSRVGRGGAWFGGAGNCRVAQRGFGSGPLNSTDGFGFRVARSSGTTGAMGSAVTIITLLDTRNWTLSAATQLRGNISGVGSYLSGTNATLTATPLAGYLFGSWTGDATGTTNPLTLLMDADKTVGATFVEDTRDPDADGLTNYQEIIVRLTDPNLPDTDGDDVNDGQEVADGTNPLVTDSDSDGLSDGEEMARDTNPLSGDSDGDGLGDLQEEVLTSTNPLAQDSDGNGIADAYEDPDKDGILNGREVNERKTNPKSADSDNDSLSDTYELVFKGPTDAFKPRIGDRLRFDLRELGFQGTYKLVGKLPVGMTFNATTGVLEGKLTGKAATSALTIQILDGKTVVRSIPLSLPIGAFPTTLTGSWQALLEDPNGLPQGLLTATLAAPGRWTATLDAVGTTTIRSATGTFDLQPAAETASITLTFPAVTGLTARSLTLGISGPDALASGSHPQGTLRGFRLARGSELPTATRAFTMVIDHGEQDGFLVPAGMGWATGSLSNKGAITLIGQLGDAQPIKGSLKLGATGQALLWLKPYRNLSSRIGGVVSLHETGAVPATALAQNDSGLGWYRATDTTELGYSSGFGPIPTEVGTRPHTAATTSAAFAIGLGLTQERFRNVVFDGGGLPDSSWSTTLPETLALDSSFKLAAVPIPGRLMAPWQGAVNAKIGSFSGTLDVAASTSGIIAGKAAVSGVLFPSSEVDAVVGAGLVKIPVAGRSGSFRTGAVVLSR